MNQLTRWYTHNMLVHYLSPHGLEQYGGELGAHEMCRKDRQNFSLRRNSLRSWSIIQHLFENQFEDDGNW